jgi:thiol-disulfide isomerase/thioredoxin
MSNKVILAGAMGAVVVMTGILAAGMKKGDAQERPRATAQASAQGATQVEETKPLGIPVASTELPAGADASEVYTALTKEIEDLAREASSTNSPDEQMRIFSEMESKLVAFRAQYPNTPEALDAVFQLGALNYSVQNNEQAALYLSEYLHKADSSDRQKNAYAHYYLAEAYRSAGKYDDAEGEYKIILNNFSDVNPRLTQFVQGNMSMLGAERKLAVGNEPIHFAVKGIKGEKLSPAEYKGKVLLIDFWATWCGPCIAEMPNVKNVYKKYHAKGFEIVGISLDQSRDKLDAYIQQQQIPWPQYFDGKYWNNEIAQMYGIKSIPTTLLVDRSGKIRYKSLRGHQLEAAVEKLVKETS